ncbi:MAG: LON peptidase substrate-binding domain-containing protein [Gammaproteobacteria bacterium]
METIPLFPLNSILFPKGRISLQIFESRYVDMIRQCLRDQSGFGVVLIETGSEVANPKQKLDIHRIGTYSSVVDWNQLPNGLLGITVEGQTTFKIVESWREDNDLCKAEVVFRDFDSVNSDPVDVGEQFQEYVDLLQGLSRHPAIEELKLNISFENLREIVWRLSELLPISNRDKQALLELSDPFDRLEQIELYIRAMNPQDNKRY